MSRPRRAMRASHRPHLMTAVLTITVLAFAAAACSSSGSKGATHDSTQRSSTTQSSTTTGASGSTGSSTAPAIDPCKLLGDKDVVAAGGKAGVHAPDDFNGTPGCDYGAVQVYVGFTPSAFDSLVKQGTPVAGVGDQASYEKEWHRLWVRSHDTRFVVKCSLCSSDTEETKLETLATTVIGKLPG